MASLQQEPTGTFHIVRRQPRRKSDAASAAGFGTAKDQGGIANKRLSVGIVPRLSPDTPWPVTEPVNTDLGEFGDIRKPMDGTLPRLDSLNVRSDSESKTRQHSEVFLEFRFPKKR